MHCMCRFGQQPRSAIIEVEGIKITPETKYDPEMPIIVVRYTFCYPEEDAALRAALLDLSSGSSGDSVVSVSDQGSLRIDCSSDEIVTAYDMLSKNEALLSPAYVRRWEESHKSLGGSSSVFRPSFLRPEIAYVTQYDQDKSDRREMFKVKREEMELKIANDKAEELKKKTLKNEQKRRHRIELEVKRKLKKREKEEDVRTKLKLQNNVCARLKCKSKPEGICPHCFAKFCLKPSHTHSINGPTCIKHRARFDDYFLRALRDPNFLGNFYSLLAIYFYFFG